MPNATKKTEDNKVRERYGLTTVFKEKRSAVLIVACEPNEKKIWFEWFGSGEVSRAARKLLNEAVALRRVL